MRDKRTHTSQLVTVRVEACQFLNHAGSRPELGRPSTQRVASIALRHKPIRHSDELMAGREEGGWVVIAGYRAGS
jgi:hypothetical protein